MARSDNAKAYKQKWARDHLARIIVDVRPDIKEVIREAASASGQGMTQYIVQACQERMERDGFTPDASEEPSKDNS